MRASMSARTRPSASAIPLTSTANAAVNLGPAGVDVVDQRWRRCRSRRRRSRRDRRGGRRRRDRRRHDERRRGCGPGHRRSRYQHQRRSRRWRDRYLREHQYRRRAANYRRGDQRRRGSGFRRRRYRRRRGRRHPGGRRGPRRRVPSSTWAPGPSTSASTSRAPTSISASTSLDTVDTVEHASTDSDTTVTDTGRSTSGDFWTACCAGQAENDPLQPSSRLVADRTRRLRRWSAALRAIGLLQPLENAAADARARLLMREVRSDIVIVGIDAASLAALERVAVAAAPSRETGRSARGTPRRPACSSTSISARSPTSLDDALLEAALAKPRDFPVVLPTFFQNAQRHRRLADRQQAAAPLRAPHRAGGR